MSDLVVGLDLDGSVLYMSPSVDLEIGRDASEIIGTPFDDLLHGDDRAGWNDVLTKVREVPGADVPACLLYTSRCV